jgi:hypothetical protein
VAGTGDIDPSLLLRVSALSRGSQRWLKTTLQAVRSGSVGADDVDEAEEPVAEEPRPARARPKVQRTPANLEDVITGKADLREQLESYPELSNELEGLADVIDLLRDAGEKRRKRGEEVLRELLEGNGDDESPEDDSGGPEPPRRRHR